MRLQLCLDWHVVKCTDCIVAIGLNGMKGRRDSFSVFVRLLCGPQCLTLTSIRQLGARKGERHKLSAETGLKQSFTSNPFFFVREEIGVFT